MQSPFVELEDDGLLETKQTFDTLAKEAMVKESIDEKSNPFPETNNIALKDRIIWDLSNQCFVFYKPSWMQQISNSLLDKIYDDLIKYPRDDASIQDLKLGIKLPDKNKFSHFVSTWYGETMVSKRYIMTVGDASQSSGYKFSNQVSTTVSWGDKGLQSCKELAEILSKLSGYILDRVHINLYQPKNGDALAWHHDNESDQKQCIICISLGAAMRLQFREYPSKKLKRQNQKHKKSNFKCDTVVTNKTLYIMTGNTQDYYQHCASKLTVAQTKKHQDDAHGEWRLSLTFRSVLK